MIKFIGSSYTKSLENIFATMESIELKIKHFNSFLGSETSIYAMAQNTENNGFFTGGGSGEIVLWPNFLGEEGLLYARTESPVLCLHVDTVDNLLLIGTLDGQLNWIDLNKKSTVKRQKWMKGGLYAIQSDEYSYYISGHGGIVTRISRDAKQATGGMQVSGIRCRALTQNSQFLISGTSEGKIYMFDKLGFNNPIISSHKHQGSVFDIIQIENNYISCGKDGKLFKWDTALKKVDEVQAHNSTINTLAPIGNSGLFATGCRDGSIRIWDSHDFELLKVIDLFLHSGHLRSVNKLIWVDHQNLLMSCSDDRQIKMWKVQ